MNKIIVPVLIAATLLTAGVASAQSYSSGYSGGCVNLANDLSYGSRGSDVSQLQTFLVAQNYPGGGSWMVTGYFGQATLAALRDFQLAQGLPQSGVADATTRQAIASVTCGFPGLGGPGYTYGNNYNYSQPTAPYDYNYNYGYSYGFPNNYNYNYGYNYGYNTCGTFPYFYPCAGATYGSAPTLNSLSPASAGPGQTVTIYGSNFDPINNTVYVGGTTISGVSSNGTSVVFTVPGNATGVVSVSVANSHGTSNALTLSTYGTSPYPYPFPCGYSGYGGYANCLPPNTGIPTLSYLSPNSGAVGTSVTIFGSGFSATNNAVHFGNGVIANISSLDGHSLSFTIPTTISGYGYQPIGLGTYNVSVTNASGAESNSLPFIITSVGPANAPTIGTITGPTSLQSGVTGTWSVTITDPANTYATVSVNWGDAPAGYATQAAPQSVQAGTQTFSFTHAYAAIGTYTITITVTNSSGQSATATATIGVTGGGQGQVALSYLSPSSDYVGTQVQLVGSGFTSDNTVHFGVGGTMHVPSYNGTLIYFTIPSYVSPCDVLTSGSVCAQYIQQVTPGSYPVYVANSNGTTQTVNFQVN